MDRTKLFCLLRCIIRMVLWAFKVLNNSVSECKVFSNLWNYIWDKKQEIYMPMISWEKLNRYQQLNHWFEIQTPVRLPTVNMIASSFIMGEKFRKGIERTMRITVIHSGPPGMHERHISELPCQFFAQLRRQSLVFVQLQWSFCFLP